MFILAIGSLLKPQETAAHMADEARVLAELRAEGLVKQSFRYRDRPGVVSILEAASVDEARAKMGRLPFVRLGITSFELSELVEF